MENELLSFEAWWERYSKGQFDALQKDMARTGWQSALMFASPATAREAVIEECARVAHDAETMWGDDFTKKYGDVTAAEAIRALGRKGDV